MRKKKTTRKRKDEQPDAAREDATFGSEDDQAAASVTIEEDSPSVESAGSEPIERATTKDVTPQRKGGGLIAWLALFAAILALLALSIDFFGDRSSAVDSRADDAHQTGPGSSKLRTSKPSAANRYRPSLSSAEASACAGPLSANWAALAERDRWTDWPPVPIKPHGMRDLRRLRFS